MRDIKDPDHPYSLEELKVISEDAIEVDEKHNCVRVTFTPTVEHCNMATVIGLCLRVKLMRSLPMRYKSSYEAWVLQKWCRTNTGYFLSAENDKYMLRLELLQLKLYGFDNEPWSSRDAPQAEEGEDSKEIDQLFKSGKKKKKCEKGAGEITLLVENVMAELEVVAEEDAELN
ncbi:unnamed protein product [Camellia sinensis]